MPNDPLSARTCLLEHLEELRSRIIVVAIAILVASVAAFFLADTLISGFERPVPAGRRPRHGALMSGVASAASCEGRD